MNGVRYARCLWKGVSNFTYKKVYKAESRYVNAKTNEPTNFRVIDNEGDPFEISKDGVQIHNKWEWVDGI